MKTKTVVQTVSVGGALTVVLLKLIRSETLRQHTLRLKRAL